MRTNKRIKNVKERAMKKGERKASLIYRSELKKIERDMANNIKKLKKLHEREIKQVHRQSEIQMERLQKKELELEKAIAIWGEKIHKADSYLLEARNTLHTRFIEKKEIFQRMARHIAEESSAIEELIGNVNEQKLKVLKTKPTMPNGVSWAFSKK